jgi:hypothetical protein
MGPTDSPVEMAAVVKKLPNSPVALAANPNPQVDHVKKLGSVMNTTIPAIYKAIAMMN